MIKKTITYTDFDGVERTEEFRFNLSKAEIVEMEMEITGGMSSMLKRIIAAKDNATLMGIFKTILLKSYGEKSPDGKRFIKSAELSEAFSQTEAYSDLFMELVTNDEAASAFINAIIPKQMVQSAT